MKRIWGRAMVVGGTMLLFLSCLVFCPPVSQAQETTTFKRIMERKTFRFCADQFNLPFSDRNAITPGVDVEVAQLIARKWGVRATFFWVTTVRRGGMSYAYRHSIAANKCDCFLGVPTGSKFEAEPGRHGLVLTKPHFGTGFVLVVRREDTTTQTLEDLRGKKVGVQMVTPADRWLFENGFDIAHYRDVADALRGLTDGEVDVALLWEPATGWTLATEGESYNAKFVEGFEMLPKLRLNLGMALRAEDRDLKEALEATLEELKKGDELPGIFERYGFPYHLPFE